MKRTYRISFALLILSYDCTGDVRYYNTPRLVVEHHRGPYNSKPLFGGVHPRAPLCAPE